LANHVCETRLIAKNAKSKKIWNDVLCGNKAALAVSLKGASKEELTFEALVGFVLVVPCHHYIMLTWKSF
jgi:hypothetical protein